MAIPDNFEQFFANQQIQISYSYLILAIILSALLAFILSQAYIRYGTSISNRRRFASNFVLLTSTTTLIITIVKSSLALSLGLVGALSIVRFRAAIKEPEELAFLFLSIAIGLGLGAGQLITTLIAFILILSFIIGRHYYHKKDDDKNLYLTISGGVKLNDIVEILKKNCSSVQLKRFDQIGDEMESSFLVEFDSFDKLEKVKNELNRHSKTINITYLDKSGF